MPYLHDRPELGPTQPVRTGQKILTKPTHTCSYGAWVSRQAFFQDPAGFAKGARSGRSCRETFSVNSCGCTASRFVWVSSSVERSVPWWDSAQYPVEYAGVFRACLEGLGLRNWDSVLRLQRADLRPDLGCREQVAPSLEGEASCFATKTQAYRRNQKTFEQNSC